MPPRSPHVETDTAQENFSSEYATIIAAKLGFEMECRAIRDAILRAGFRGDTGSEIEETIDLLDTNAQPHG